MKITDQQIIKGFYLILFPTVLLFLIVHVAVLQGALKERESKDCTTPAQMSQWRSVINLAEGVYLNVSKDYRTNLEALEGSVKYWRDSYLWNQTQLASCQEGNAFLQEELFDN